MPQCLEGFNVEAVAYVYTSSLANGVACFRISTQRGLKSINHFVALLPISCGHIPASAPADQEVDPTLRVDVFYFSLSRQVLRTVADGDCALEVM